MKESRWIVENPESPRLRLARDQLRGMEIKNVCTCGKSNFFDYNPDTKIFTCPYSACGKKYTLDELL